MRYQGSQLLRARDTFTKAFPKSDSTLHLCTPVQCAICALWLLVVRNSREGRIDSKNIHASGDKVQLSLRIIIPNPKPSYFAFPTFTLTFSLELLTHCRPEAARSVPRTTARTWCFEKVGLSCSVVVL